MTKTELLAFLFPPTEEVPMADEIVRDWIVQSRRFQFFAAENKVKIRKKLRLAQTPEAGQSLLLELDLARCFVEDARCQVEYEKHGAGQTRQPDLTVTYRTRTAFNVEATRVLMVHAALEDRKEKLARVVCHKLEQAVPEMLNCLVVATEGGSLTESDLSAAMKSLKQRVEQHDPTLLSHIPFRKPADFYKWFQWLNGIILCSQGQSSIVETVSWINTQSRHPLPADIQALLKARINLTVTDIPARLTL